MDDLNMKFNKNPVRDYIFVTKKPHPALPKGREKRRNAISPPLGEDLGGLTNIYSLTGISKTF